LAAAAVTVAQVAQAVLLAEAVKVATRKAQVVVVVAQAVMVQAAAALVAVLKVVLDQ
jgi:hypothetical protein